MEALTDLEAVALGCVHRYQPCTAHFIRTQFRASPSARFSDSAGSVYPMMARLAKRSLVSVRLQTEGRRQVRCFRLPKRGVAALRAWIGPPPRPDVATTFDPLRTQIFFLDVLTPSQRARWLDDVERTLVEQLDSIEAKLDEMDSDSPVLRDTLDWLGSQNARLEALSRLEWIRLARSRLV